ncbi:MAG: hypothetical protein ABL874_08820 [Sphingopyxis sp.]
MSMRIFDLGLCAAALILAGCGRAVDNQAIADTEARAVRDAATGGRIFCALGGASGFRLDCTMDRMESNEGTVLVLGRDDAGFRRFRITRDGRGVVTADGAEQAVVRVIEGGMIEVTVAQDRYRLPATIRGRE